MSNPTTVKSQAYDHPSYLIRMQTSLPAIAAGAGAVSGKFVAFAQLQVMSVGAYIVTQGTSSATFTSGTSTLTYTNATYLSVLRVYNTNTSTSILAALATATYGPFPIGGTSALSSSGVGNYAYFAINTATGTAGLNGIPINQGDYLITTAGADATAVYVPVFEYQVLPTANVTA